MHWLLNWDRLILHLLHSITRFKRVWRHDWSFDLLSIIELVLKISTEHLHKVVFLADCFITARDLVITVHNFRSMLHDLRLLNWLLRDSGLLLELSCDSLRKRVANENMRRILRCDMNRLFGRSGYWFLYRSFVFEEIRTETRSKAKCLSGRLGYHNLVGLSYLSTRLLLLLLLELLETLRRLVAR